MLPQDALANENDCSRILRAHLDYVRERRCEQKLARQKIEAETIRLPLDQSALCRTKALVERQEYDLQSKRVAGALCMCASVIQRLSTLTIISFRS